ncbi:MAG: hypothetical protein IKW97_07355 [Muribaculaceae bacterium]|nr:hypothetical protein [Muribaculaceae bacterium]
MNNIIKDQNSVENYLILKLEQSNAPQISREGVKIKKITSSISVGNFIKLLFYANNDINPRNATNNKVAKDIIETLTVSPELFSLMSKGIVVATKHCTVLDRNRVRISLYDPETADDQLKLQEGIMDGGHNAFAIAYFIVNVLDFEVKWKRWIDCKKFWNENYTEITKRFKDKGGDDNDQFRFSIPIEILSPENNEDDEEYCDAIASICDARNNNVQLGQPAKDNQEGCYDYLKTILPKEVYPISWKPGEDNGVIRVEDVISLATIPFMYLQKKGKLDSDIFGTLNKVSVYSQKGACIKFFGKVIMNEKFSDKPVGEGKYILKSGLIKSALNMTEDIMKFFDILYDRFPGMYNEAGGSFGKMNSVELKKNKNFLFRTLDTEVSYKYPYAYFYPVLCGITELMKYDPRTDTIGWIVNPSTTEFNLKELDISLYTNLFPSVHYNPNVIGKTSSFYDVAAIPFTQYLVTHGLFS